MEDVSIPNRPDDSTARRIGLFGGSFDPVHHGHLIAARAVAEQLRLSRVVLIPASTPPHKREARLSPPQHRVAMLRLAIEGDPLFDVDECELHRPGPSYTIETVRTIQATWGRGAELFWIVGADALGELASWHRIAELVDLIPLVFAARPGVSEPDLGRLTELIGEERCRTLLNARCPTPAIEISASAIRARAARGLPIRYLTPPQVAEYIQQNGLYRT